ncbi:MAG: CHAT domain-containing protein, partial [Sphingobacteriales bacterium]
YEMIRLHTAASFLQNKQRLFLPEKLNVLMLGDVDYDCLVGEPGSRPAEYRKIWDKLPGSKKEIADIRNLLGKNVSVEILDSCKATEQNFVAKVNNSRFDIIHLATHGFYFKGANPFFALREDAYVLERSGIVLSGANHPKTTTSPFDAKGMFTALDFINMDFRKTGLFVLSTCHSGEGSNLHSGPPVGLTLALLRNLVNAMILSNRAVPDAETSMFMTTLYKYINTNRNVDECFTKMLRELHSTYPTKDWSFFDLVY